jgi:hypothetical protein
MELDNNAAAVMALVKMPEETIIFKNRVSKILPSKILA